MEIIIKIKIVIVKRLIHLRCVNNIVLSAENDHESMLMSRLERDT